MFIQQQLHQQHNLKVLFHHQQLKIQQNMKLIANQKYSVDKIQQHQQKNILKKIHFKLIRQG